MNYKNKLINSTPNPINKNDNTLNNLGINKPCFTPSLCIPRLFNNVTEETIRITMNNLQLGVLHKIDITNKINKYGDNYKMAFIHFKKWNIDERTNSIRENLINGKEVKIIYDDPWFWKVSAYRPPNSLHIHTNYYQSKPNPVLEIKLPRSPSTSPPRKRKDNNEEKDNEAKDNEE